MTPTPETAGKETLVEHTPTPWRLKTTGNLGSCIEAYSGRRYDDLDDGYRVVATYQECCASQQYLDLQANREANGAFIVEAVNSYESLRSQLAKAVEALESYASSQVYGELARSTLLQIKGEKR